jgi:hypothetical protein
MKCRLTLIRTDHEQYPLRTTEAVGFCDREPTKDLPFQMHAAPLEGGDIRMITTTRIQEVREVEKKKVEFDTEYSTYEWEFLGFGN